MIAAKQARLFKRAWRVTIYDPRPGSYFETQPNGVEIEQLRVTFKITKNAKAEPNTSEITVSNLARDTRSSLVKKPKIIRLEAGYADDVGPRHLFTGDLRHGYSRDNGTTTNETIFMVGDGSRAYASARVSKSYGAGTPVLTMLRDAAAGMGLLLPRAIEQSAELKNERVATGGVLHGLAREQLSELLAPFGYGWSVQDGRLQILKDDEVRPDRAHLISADTGLIGSPEFGTPSVGDTKKGKPLALKFRTLLFPGIVPGAKLDVRAESVSGIFRAETVTHQGDTHGDDWFTEVDAKPA